MVQFIAMDTETVRKLQAGEPDANGQIPERHVSTGSGTPCRHCLKQVEEGEEYLILSHRPFPDAQPYAEQGPIFLHARECERHTCDGSVPTMMQSPEYIVRGYNADNRIVYRTAKVVPTKDIPNQATDLLTKPEISFVHVRSATTNRFQFRIEAD